MPMPSASACSSASACQRCWTAAILNGARRGARLRAGEGGGPGAISTAIDSVTSPHARQSECVLSVKPRACLTSPTPQRRGDLLGDAVDVSPAEQDLAGGHAHDLAVREAAAQDLGCLVVAALVE